MFPLERASYKMADEIPFSWLEEQVEVADKGRAAAGTLVIRAGIESSPKA